MTTGSDRDGHGVDGVSLIEAERNRQIVEEGYTAEHDDGNTVELALAGAAYAFETCGMEEGGIELWPWAREAWKPTGDRIRDLTKAGALIAAAIDAELRKAARG